MALNVTDTDFDAEVVQHDQPVLVDFWAPWCAPCRMMTPVIDELATRVAGRAKIVKVNVDEAGQTAVRYGVNALPTIMVFRNGEVVAQGTGVATVDALEKLVESVSDSAAA